MVHRGGLDRARPGCGGEQEEGKAVGSPGDRDTDPARGSKPVEIGNEAGDRFRWWSGQRQFAARLAAGSSSRSAGRMVAP